MPFLALERPAGRPQLRAFAMFKAPSQLPPLSLLLDDLPTRCRRRIARHLGISERTLKRYQEQDQAPRLVMLALFWESRWGQSVIDCEVINRDRLQRGQIEALQRHAQALQRTIERLSAMGGHGAANDPLWGVSGCGRADQPAAMHRPASPAAVAAGWVEGVQELGTHPAGQALPAAGALAYVALQAVGHQPLARPFQEQDRENRQVDDSIKGVAGQHQGQARPLGHAPQLARFVTREDLHRRPP